MIYDYPNTPKFSRIARIYEKELDQSLLEREEPLEVERAY